MVYTNKESQGYIILVKLNPVTLSKEYITRLNSKQETVMNCFMVSYRALLAPILDVGTIKVSLPLINCAGC